MIKEVQVRGSRRESDQNTLYEILKDFIKINNEWKGNGIFLLFSDKAYAVKHSVNIF